jgi:hypothetical protein
MMTVNIGQSGTPGDLLFHIRAGRYVLRIEFERLVIAALGEGASWMKCIGESRHYQ